jgi:hypothetical protein
VVQRDQIDYRTWNDDKLKAMLADPVLAVERLQDRMEYYIQNVEEYYSLFEASMARLNKERKLNSERAEKEGESTAQKYEKEVIFPLSVETSNLGLNVRYFSLAALSLRRFVAGRSYLLLKANHIAKPGNNTYREYFSRFQELLDDFEASIVPYLVEADI